MAAALLFAVVDGFRLVFGDVVEDVQMLFLGVVEALVEFMCDEFIVAALEGEVFTLHMISHAKAGS